MDDTAGVEHTRVIEGGRRGRRGARRDGGMGSC